MSETNTTYHVRSITGYIDDVGHSTPESAWEKVSQYHTNPEIYEAYKPYTVVAVTPTTAPRPKRPRVELTRCGTYVTYENDWYKVKSPMTSETLEFYATVVGFVRFGKNKVSSDEEIAALMDLKARTEAWESSTPM